LSILDKIKIDFKHVGYGRSTSGWNDSDETKFNNFEATIHFDNKSIRIPYNVATVDLKDSMNQMFENMFRIDLIGRIIIDCYPFESVDQVKSCLEKKGIKESDEYYQKAFEDVNAQSKKYRTLFTENDLQQMKKELRQWLDDHPKEAEIYGKLELEY